MLRWGKASTLLKVAFCNLSCNAVLLHVICDRLHRELYSVAVPEVDLFCNVNVAVFT